MRIRKKSEKTGWAFQIGVIVLKPLLLSISSRTWIGGRQIPEHGGCILAVNHVSHLDPLTTAHFVYDHGRVPRYLAKASLFTAPVIGAIIKNSQQIPVERLTANAVGAYDAAIKALAEGKVVVVYPEGTLTRDPDLWPMKAKSGAARLALATGAPVFPVGQWGVQDILAPYAKRLRFRPRGHHVIKVGPPVELDDLRGRDVNAEVVNEATRRIMDAIRDIVEELRGEKAPEEYFDPRKAGVKLIGDPNDPRNRS